MSEKPDARTWRNPLFVANSGGERIAQSLMLGAELRRKVAAGCALGTFVIECPVPETLRSARARRLRFRRARHGALGHRFLPTRGSDRRRRKPRVCRHSCAPGATNTGLIGKTPRHGSERHHGAARRVARARARDRRASALCAARRPWLLAAHQVSTRSSEPLRALDESTYLVVQIEGRKALDSIGEIAVDPGHRCSFVGPYDLALSLGVPPGSAQVFAAAEQVARAVPRSRRIGHLHRRSARVCRLGRATLLPAVRELRWAHAGERRPRRHRDRHGWRWTTRSARDAGHRA